MKKLPKYWFIDIRKGNPEIIKNWIKSTYPNFSWFFGLKYYGIHPIITCTGYNFGAYTNEHYGTEITFNQFEEFILNNIMEKTIKLSVDKARKMYGKSKEMDELLLANFSKEELEKLALPTKWEDLDIKGGYFINYQSDILYTSTSSEDDNDLIFSSEDGNENMFATIKQAKSALAMAQLSQLMKVYNGDWKPDWNSCTNKFTIIRMRDNITITSNDTLYQFLAFRTEDLRNEFFKNFKDLIKQYFMID